MNNYFSKNPTILKNCRCSYCGCKLDTENKTRDHLIGRRFVPKGKLHSQWNLILNACMDCNSRKSDLEDDIAAISLLSSLSGRFSHGDVDVIEDARRRAPKSISRRTRKPVVDSDEKLTFDVRLNSEIEMAVGLVCPPQIDEMRAFELARLHMVGLFFMQTYNRETCEGGWRPGGFFPIAMSRRSNWGSPIMKGFMSAIREWEHRIDLVTAGGFFKAMSRRHLSTDCWAWAIEWNQSFRLVGLYGKSELAQEIVDGLPVEEMRMLVSGRRSMSYRIETSLSEADDTLFLPFS